MEAKATFFAEQLYLMSLRSQQNILGLQIAAV